MELQTHTHTLSPFHIHLNSYNSKISFSIHRERPIGGSTWPSPAAVGSSQNPPVPPAMQLNHAESSVPLLQPNSPPDRLPITDVMLARTDQYRVPVLPLAWVADGIVNFTGWPYAEWNHASTWHWWKSGPVCAVFPDLSSMAMLAPWCPWPADCLLIWKHYDSQTNRNTFRHLFQDLRRSMIGWSLISTNWLACRKTTRDFI